MQTEDDNDPLKLHRHFDAIKSVNKNEDRMRMRETVGPVAVHHGQRLVFLFLRRSSVVCLESLLKVLRGKTALKHNINKTVPAYDDACLALCVLAYWLTLE